MYIVVATRRLLGSCAAILAELVVVRMSRGTVAIRITCACRCSVVGDCYLYSTSIESVAKHIGNRYADCRVGKRLNSYDIGCLTRIGIGYSDTICSTFQIVDCCCITRVVPCVGVVCIRRCTKRPTTCWCSGCNTNVAGNARLVVGGYRYGKFGMYDDCSAVRGIVTWRYCTCSLYRISVSACNWRGAFTYRKGCACDCIVEAGACRSGTFPCKVEAGCSAVSLEYYVGECLIEAQGLVEVA